MYAFFLCACFETPEILVAPRESERGVSGKYTGMDFFRGDASSIGHAQSAIFAVITEFVIN